MRLQRNEGQNKYTVINNNTGEIRTGAADAPDEFFVIMLKDRHARPALLAYAASVEASDPEMAADVRELADRSGERSPFCKDPD